MYNSIEDILNDVKSSGLSVEKEESESSFIVNINENVAANIENSTEQNRVFLSIFILEIDKISFYSFEVFKKALIFNNKYFPIAYIGYNRDNNSLILFSSIFLNNLLDNEPISQKIDKLLQLVLEFKSEVII